MQSRELVKLYYRIGEVSEIVGVQPHVLRYWETEFRSIRPQKSSKGQRVYSRRDVEKLLRVKDLLRNQGFTIAGARKRLSDVSEAGPASVGHSSAPLSATTQVVGAVSLAAVSPVAVLPAAVSPAAVSPAAVSPAAVSASRESEVAEELHAEASERGLPEHGNSAHRISDRSAKDMRKALLGLRQDLMRMLDQLSTQAHDAQ